MGSATHHVLARHDESSWSSFVDAISVRPPTDADGLTVKKSRIDFAGFLPAGLAFRGLVSRSKEGMASMTRLLSFMSVVVCLAHAEEVEDILLHEIDERGPGQGRYDFRQCGVVGVVVLECSSERRRLAQVPEVPHP